MQSKKAYTLMELLIALGLLIVLMGAVWAMVETFSKVFLQGEQRAERSQLIRSLSQVLEADLNAAIQDPLYPTRNASNTAEIVRHFGLLGSEYSLQIDVLQINPFKTADFSDQLNAEAPEIKTIYYNFTPPGQPGQSGLLRREIDFETPMPSSVSSQTSDMIGSTVSALGDAVEEMTITEKMNEMHHKNPQVPTDHERMLAPEVVQSRFRYFDGKQWHNNWDSIQKKGLPVAIAVELKLLNQSEIGTYEETRDAEILRKATEQRIVVRVPSTSLEKQTELQRDQPIKETPAVDSFSPSPLPPIETPEPVEPALQPERRNERSRFRD